MANLPNVNESNFKAEVLQSSIPVLADFWAPWCGPCKMLVPALEELAVELAGKIKFIKIDIDDAGDLARESGVRNIPYLMLFKKGQVVDQKIGTHSKTDIKNWLEKNI
jgi:thioredoxin 1